MLKKKKERIDSGYAPDMMKNENLIFCGNIGKCPDFKNVEIGRNCNMNNEGVDRDRHLIGRKRQDVIMNRFEMGNKMNKQHIKKRTTMPVP